MVVVNRSVIFVLLSALAIWAADEKKPQKKKDIRDYTDADLERLSEEWEKDDDPLEEDELPEHLRKPPPVDFSKLDPSNPESMLQASKKGKSTMLFASVSGNPSQQELEDVTGLWQTSLFNGHIDAQRFMIDEKRVIFMFKDGSQAWEAKDFLIQQERCEEVTLESKQYPGKAAKQQPSKKEL